MFMSVMMMVLMSLKITDIAHAVPEERTLRPVQYFLR
jgi:hypothetical protein